MKKILLFSPLFMSFIACFSSTTTQAMDDDFLITVNNKSWNTRLRLTSTIDYEDAPQKENRIVLEGVTTDKPVTTKTYKIPKGTIRLIHLMCTNYHEGHKLNDLSETLIANGEFSPLGIPLLRITFTVDDNIISSDFSYKDQLEIENK